MNCKRVCLLLALVSVVFCKAAYTYPVKMPKPSTIERRIERAGLQVFKNKATKNELVVDLSSQYVKTVADVAGKVWFYLARRDEGARVLLVYGPEYEQLHEQRKADFEKILKELLPMDHAAVEAFLQVCQYR